MKILIANEFFSQVGGAETVAYNTYRMLKDKGHEVNFFANTRKPYFETDYEYIKYFSKDEFSAIGYLKNPIRYYYDKKSGEKFKEFLKLTKPDLIHLHNILVFSPYILKCCEGIPVILTIHQSDIACPGSTLMYRNKSFCDKQFCRQGNYLPCVLNNCVKNNIEASLRRSLLIYLYAKNLKYVNHFITPSNALKNVILKSNLGIKENNITTINNFLTEKALETVPNYSNKGYFLYAGRLNKEKNVITLLKAIKELPDDIQLHIVGKGPEESSLKKFVKQNNMHNVKFMGFMSKEQLQEEYQNCIATILPCKWFEVFGLTIIESFIHGKPVIASDIGGIPEIIEHNKNGLLFETGNINQLKEAVMLYKNNPDKVIEHGKSGYQKAIQDYTQEKHYKKLLNLYKIVLENSYRKDFDERSISNNSII